MDDRLGEVALNATYYTSSKFELVGFTASGYQLVNARIDWNNIFRSQISVGAFARNLFNAKYVSGPAITAVGLPLTSVIVGDPRAYGLVLRVAFGPR
jgi:iron complex outermembrane receptor protein